ncbi:MAG: response regulator [Alphaproteobacteria bacterium]|nr:response regulator [Alphaproteobacteria bacterium]
MSKTVLVVEDNYLIAEDLAEMCEEIGVAVIGHAVRASDALQIVADKKPDYVLMDMRLKGQRDGVDVAMEIHKARPQTKIVYITGSDDPGTMERIHEDHPHDILLKPINPAQLKSVLG